MLSAPNLLEFYANAQSTAKKMEEERRKQYKQIHN